MGMLHNSLLNYYERIFAFTQCHGWSITELENLFPWELDVMTSLLSNYIETQEIIRNQQQMANRR